MKFKQLWAQRRPHLWFQLYWVIYLIWFFWLDLTIQTPKYIIHSPLDDMIPFNEWFVFPYCSWFLLLAGVTALLWWCDTASYDKLCLMMFSGMTFCLVIYMLLPNGLDIRPTAEAVGRSNIAMSIGERVPLHPLPVLGLHGAGLQPEQTGEASPGPAGGGLGVGGADLRFHRVHKAALHPGRSVRTGRGIRVGAGAVPPEKGVKGTIWAKRQKIWAIFS